MVPKILHRTVFYHSRQDFALCGEGHRARRQAGGALPEGNVHRPVGAARLAELPGPVERIYDPHPVGRQPRRIVGPLLGEHHITGPGFVQPGQQKVMRP
jgi:hypothetical protein